MISLPVETILFVRELQDIKVANVEEPIELVCELSKAGLKVEWYKNDKRIRRDEKYNYVVEDGTVHKLIVEHPSVEDAAVYKAVYEKLETSASLSIAGELSYFAVPHADRLISRTNVISSLCLAVPPSIGKHSYEDRLVLREGTSAVIEIPFTANPEPTCTWKFKNGKLPDARRFKTDSITNMTSMTLSKAKRSDTGSYSLTLENEHGKVTFKIEIVVLCKCKPLPFTNYCISLES